MKGRQLSISPVPETSLLTARWFLIGLVEFELAFGLWLLCGLFPRQTRWAAIACFTSFTCVTVYLGLSGAASCGCFGNVPLNPWLVAAGDLCAIAALGFARPRADAFATNFHGSARRAAVVAVASVLLGVPAASLMGSYRAGVVAADGAISGDAGLVVLEPQTWLGKQFPLLRHIDVGDEFARGEWLLLFYHHDCPQCRRAIARLDSMPAEGSRIAARRTALVEIPPFGPFSYDSGSGILRAKLNADRQWFVATPIEVVLAEGTVVQVGKTSDMTNEIRVVAAHTDRGDAMRRPSSVSEE